MSESIIRAENITKTYEMGKVGVHALRGITLDVKQGEYLSIMGPSGSGKTTLLDVVSCLLRPSSGEVYINGLPISKMSDSQLAQVRGKTIGFVFQTFNLISRMTALENVMLPLWFQGIPLAERRSIATETLKAVGLEDRMHHKPMEMSGGQRQRVALARALAVNPDAIVADEPTGNLDSRSGEQILGIIDRLNQEMGKTIIMVTHERYVAERAQRTVHIRDGLIHKETVL